MFSDVYQSFYYGSLILAALISIALLRRVNISFKWLGVLVMITLVSEFTAYYISLHSHNNSIVYHFFTPVEYSLYAVIYDGFFSNKKWHLLLSVSVAAFIILEIMNALYFQPLQVDDTNIMIIESIWLVFLSLMLFTHIRTTHISENILWEGVFWFNSMVLLYYSFDILMWGLHNLEVYRLKNPPMMIYKMNLLFSAVLYLVYGASIFLNFHYQRKHLLQHE